MDPIEINKAMGAHGVWKVRLRDAIERGMSDYDPHLVALDNHCEFGKWFYSIPVAARPAEFWDKIQEIHARFHKEAGRILALAVTGRSEEALAFISDLKGEFVTTSNQLTMALSAWEKATTQG